ncbi:putative Sugar transporter [Aphelenchoides besseyi]|nr:putative Sugar transporter [Aphelenchoides besseyi]
MEHKLTRNLLLSVIVCCFGSMYRMGFHMSAVNPTEVILVKSLKKMLKDHYNVENQSTIEWIWGLVAGCFFLAASFGALTSNLLKSHFGRRTGLLISQFIFILGSIAQALAYFSLFELFFIGQLTVGYALGLSASFLTLFIEEIAHPSYSFVLYTCVAIGIEMGAISANVLGINVVLGDEKTWPAVFLFPAIFNILCSVILLFWIHETPIQLLKNSNRSKALESVSFYYQLEDSEAEQRLSDIKKQYTTQSESQEQKSMWRALIDRTNRKALLLSFLTSTTTNFSGILGIALFGTNLFSTIGLNSTTAGFVNAGIFSFSCIGLLISLSFAKNISHRRLLLIGIPVMCMVNVGFIFVLSLKIVSLLVIDLYLFLCQNVTLQAALLGTLMIVFCLAFSNSVEKVMWYNGTAITQPQYIDATSSLTVAITYFTAFLAPFFFSPLKGAVGQWSFMLFIIELIAAWIVFFIWYPNHQTNSITETLLNA